MSARQSEKHFPWTPLRAWHRLSWRWKMTLVGVAIGDLSASLWTIPGAYFALSNGYLRHGTIYVVVTVRGRRVRHTHAPPGNPPRERPQCNRLKMRTDPDHP